MIVALAKPMGIPFFIVSQAPHDGASDKRNGWWQKLESQVQRCAHNGCLICMGDFNARLGCQIKGSVGELLCDQFTDNGERLITCSSG